MAKFNASTFSGISIDKGDTSLTFTFVDDQDNPMNVTVPLDELPHLFLLMSRSWAGAQGRKTGVPSLAYTLAVEGFEVVAPQQATSVGLILNLPEGMDVSFSLPVPLAQHLSSELAEATGIYDSDQDAPID